MGVFDELFGRDKSDPPVALEPQKIQRQDELYGWVRPGAQRLSEFLGTPYGGPSVTDIEQAGLDRLRNVVRRDPMSDSLYAGARGELEKTFSGQYDPVGSTYYQAYRTAVMRELEEAKDRLAARTSASDKFFGGGRIAAEGELEETATNNLAVMLGQSFENERNRRLQAIPLAQAFTDNAADLRAVAASQQFGGLGLQRDIAMRAQRLQELGIPFNTALQLATARNEFYAPGYEPSFFERILIPLMSVQPLAGGGSSGQGRGATFSFGSGSAAGSAAGGGSAAGSAAGAGSSAGSAMAGI